MFKEFMNWLESFNKPKPQFKIAYDHSIKKYFVYTYDEEWDDYLHIIGSTFTEEDAYRVIKEYKIKHTTTQPIYVD